MARPHIEPFCDRDNHFKPMRLLGFGTGMHYKMLSMDTDTGACSMTVPKPSRRMGLKCSSRSQNGSIWGRAMTQPSSPLRGVSSLSTPYFQTT